MRAADSKKPTRTCIACGENSTKASLVRFVRSSDGAVFCDASGRASGRGAYLCANEDCFSAAAKRGRLGRALKCEVKDADYQRLEESFNDLCQSLGDQQPKQRA